MTLVMKLIPQSGSASRYHIFIFRLGKMRLEKKKLAVSFIIDCISSVKENVRSRSSDSRYSSELNQSGSFSRFSTLPLVIAFSF